MAAIKTPHGEFSMKNEDLFILGLAGAALLWLVTRNASAIAQAAAGAVVGAAGGAVAGTAIGIGDAIGVPRTSAEKCAADKAAGNWWNASFDCPAGDFIGGIFSGSAPASGGTLNGLKCPQCARAGACSHSPSGVTYEG